ncbi:MAG TPA: response regulator [Bryobacteraceae bacterium]
MSNEPAGKLPGGQGSITRSILLVEDNPADAALVREALAEHGVEGQLVVIADGDKAIQFIEALKTPADCPDLLIVDLNLPRRPGSDVLECIRKSAQCRDATVVILSSSDALPDRIEATELGASAYIRKPSRLEEFLKLGATFRAMLEG